MKSFWICAFLVATIGAYAQAQDQVDYDDYNVDDYDDLDKKLDEEISTFKEKTDIENDLKVEEEIQQFRKADGEVVDAVDDPKDTIDSIDDYQFEDNRDKFKEEDNNDKEGIPSDNDGSFEANSNGGEHAKEPENDDYNAENRPEPDDKENTNRNEDYALLWGDDSVAPLPVPEETENQDENKAIIDETQKILEEDADNFEEEIKKEIREDDIKTNNQPNLEQIIHETKQILAESDDSFNNDKPNDLNDSEADTVDIENMNVDQNIAENKYASKEDTVDKVYADLNADLDKLFETLDKLKDDGSNDEENVKDFDTENLENSNESNVAQDVVENKYASEEETANKVNDDTNSDLDDLLKTLNKLKGNGSNDEENVEDKINDLGDVDSFYDYNENDDFDNNNMEGSEELGEDNKDDDMVDLDKLLEDILSEDDMKVDDTAAEKADDDISVPLINDALNEPNPDDAFEKDVESVDSKIEPILYGNDAIVNNELKENDSIENSDKDADTNALVEKEIKTTLVDDLTSAEMLDLIEQFKILHGDDIDVHSETFNNNVAPVHLTLKLDDPTIITSPLYPSPYPTNNIVDYIVEAEEGVGIELNITEFAVNGALGDYLLIKPGGIDDSGHDGLLFTYRLNSERRFRFTDVDRLFMRFESKLGMQFFRGWVISAKMIAPIVDPLDDVVPEPEAVISPPHSTITLTLAVALPLFEDPQYREEFRMILADMAEEYIRENNISPGLNSTAEVTQITSVSLCPISWPNYQQCSQVTFGVSLVPGDEDPEDLALRLNNDDLRDMWATYQDDEPFVSRLMRMEIYEFAPPGSAAMTAWLVIAGGVVISMAMLAFVLWRYSCFEDYTRMKAYSDTDSLHNEKRGLDLYPTPHQTLPPLYAENEYKWQEEDSTRVDMGGFANRSYTENMYDFESDEEVVAQRDRTGAVTARDVYSSNV